MNSVSKIIIAVIFIQLISSRLHGREISLKALADLSQELLDRKKNDSALIISEQLIAMAQKRDSAGFTAKGYFLKATALESLGKPKDAIDQLYKALKYCSDTAENKLRAGIYNYLGLMNYEQKNIDIAKSYYRAEISLRREMHDTARTVNCLINLSAMHRRLKELDSSGFVLGQARSLIGEEKQSKTFGYFYHASGTHYQTLFKRDSLKPQQDSAIKYYSKALAIWLGLKIESEAVRPLFNMGLIFHSMKQFDKALENYKKAQEIVGRLGLKNEQVVVLGNLAELYWDKNDFKSSADFFRQYIEAKEALQKDEVNYYALELDKQLKTEENKELIRTQQVALAEKDRNFYRILFVAAVFLGAFIVLMIYFAFRKKVQSKVEEAKKKFFANIAHEIRTPLSMIQAPLLVLKGKTTGGEDLSNFDLAERNIQRLNELISQMLDISKIDAHKYVLLETYGDLSIFFHDLVTAYSKIALEKNIVLVPDIRTAYPLAFFDKDALEKISGNLLSNAIKYSGAGSKVGIEVSQKTEGGKVWLSITVWDTGAGIPGKEQVHIFDRFYRSDRAAAHTKGAGIGLALVNDLVQLHGGTIELLSAENEGASFTVTLPLKLTAEKTTATPGGPDSRYSVLMVEDDQDILEFNARQLKQKNIAVLPATSGEQALALLEETLPDLVISDLMLPGIDGLAFLKLLKNNPATDHIPFIMLSAKGSAASRIEALEAGAQFYLAKPFVPAELNGIVVNQLEILARRKNDFRSLISPASEKNVEKTETHPYVGKLLKVIHDQFEDPDLTVEKLADLMAINRSHFQRKVKALTGLSPSEIIKDFRLERSKALLREQELNITEIAYRCGFSSQSYFTKCFVQKYGFPPSELLQQTA